MNPRPPTFAEVYQQSADAARAARDEREAHASTAPISDTLASHLPPNHPARAAWRFFHVNQALPADSPYQMTDAGLVAKEQPTNA